ncbi:MAG: alginate biosynthesis protein AlgK [Moraxellaceae bacterium]|jgi:TPR repeat protein|nr:alginate biosynthesis protein AlgK [Moraxellaceae bacterium]
MDARKAKRRAVLAGLLLCLSPLALAELPDLKRGQAALDAGDRVTAEREFRALAEFGLPEAQIALGDLLSSGATNQRRVKEAIDWYYKAGFRTSKGYSRIAQLYATDFTVDPADIDVIIDKLVRRHDRGERALAADIGGLLLARGAGHNLPEVKVWATRAKEWGDVRGDLQLGMLCDVPLARPENPKCAQEHYRAAAKSSTEAAGRLIAVLQRHPELGVSSKVAAEVKGTFLPAERYQIYRTYLKAASNVPQMSVAEVLLADLFDETTKPVRESPALAMALVDRNQMEFDKSIYDPTDAAVELLAAYAKNTGPEAKRKFLGLIPYVRSVRPLEAALIEAEVYIAGTLLPAEPHKAEAALLPWAEKAPAAALLLGDMYRVGYLDEADYGKAVRYYTLAGQSGMGTAWYSLTRLYLGNPGFIPDRVRAEQFADLARKAGYLQVDYLLETIPELQGAR